MSRRRRGNRGGGGGGGRASLMSFAAFIAVLFIGGALILSFILGFFGGHAGTISMWAHRIALIVGAIVTLYYSFFFARTKRGFWFIAWVIAFIAIVLFLILGWAVH